MQDTPTSTPNRRRKMTAKAINKAIREKHGSVRNFARMHGRNWNWVLDVIHGRETSAPVARLVADVVGREPHEIWPRLYAEDGGALSTLYRRAS